MGPAAEEITIIHFNDVYNVEEREQEPVGGAARFCTAVKNYDHLSPMILFSGDIFAPSIRKLNREIESKLNYSITMPSYIFLFSCAVSVLRESLVLRGSLLSPQEIGFQNFRDFFS